ESRNFVVEAFDRFASLYIRAGLALGMGVAALAERDHLLDVRAHGFRLGLRGLDAIFKDQRGHQVAQKRAPVRGVTSEFPSCFAVTHGSLSSVLSTQYSVPS